MKKLFFSFLFFSTFLSSEEDVEKQLICRESEPQKSIKSKMFYISFGLAPGVALGLGFRNQIGHWAFDGSLQGMTILFVSTVQLSLGVFYIPQPNLASQFYVGGGLIALAVHALYDLEFARFPIPYLAFGKEYINKKSRRRFIQAQAGPTQLGVLYGVCF